MTIEFEWLFVSVCGPWLVLLTGEEASAASQKLHYTVVDKLLHIMAKLDLKTCSWKFMY